jgi:membrane fusion protein, macrolide-specific efflux system
MSNDMLVDTNTKTTPSPPRLRRPRRRLLWGGLALALVAAAGTLAFRHVSRESAPAFKTAAVVNGDIEKTVTALGALQPKDYVDVGAQVSGQLKKVHVDIGDRVQKGELLAEIDPTVFETRTRTDKANLANLRAQLDEQEANLVLARQQLQRNQNLFKAKIVSEDTLQTAEATLAAGQAKADSLRAQIDGAQATLDGDMANLGYTKIYAPMGGTVVSQTALEGQTLNANQTAPVIVRVADLDTMTVWAQVAEADVVKLKPGTAVYFTTLGMPDRRWPGTVQQIQPTPQTVNDVVLYNVLIDVKNDDHVLMTSMTAQVFFVLGEAKGVPLVPVAALGQPRAGSTDEYDVRVLTSEGPRRRAVKIGISDRTSAQVLSGLAVGDQVIVGTPAQAGGAATRTGGGQRLPGIFGLRL